MHVAYDSRYEYISYCYPKRASISGWCNFSTGNMAVKVTNWQNVIMSINISAGKKIGSISSCLHTKQTKAH